MIRTFFILLITSLLLSCAQQVPLTGGEKDKAAPIEVISSPSNKSVNFAATNVVIEFDEFIQLKNLNSQLIVSPIINPKPKITVKGKKLIINLPENLTPNTTYSINFGSAIQDITEYNPFLNYKYVFSTGSFLDSLSYGGNVVNAFDLSPQEKVYVLLYENTSDSTPYIQLPKYVSLTDKDGNYEITNIAKGDYKVFALKDINSNYLFDLPNEEVAFRKEVVSIKESRTKNRLELFEEDHKLQYIKNSNSNKYGEFESEFNKPFDSLSIKALNHKEDQGWFLHEINSAQTKITSWITGLDSLKKVEIVYTENKTIIDTVTFKVTEKKNLVDTLTTIKDNINASFDLNQNIMLSLKRPFVSYETDNIRLYEDSLLVTTFFTDISLRDFELAYDFKENTNYYLFIPPGTFEDIYGLKNDTLLKQFKTKEKSDYGIINLNLTPYFTENYILQLYKGKNLVEEQFYSGSQKITYSYLKPGDYTIKLIIDNNNNKKWDTGIYLKNQQPEKVIYYEKAIKIRANWDNDIIWSIIE